jgi:hypothetical protein
MTFTSLAALLSAASFHRRSRRGLDLALAVFLLPALSSAATYYLSPGGSDSNPGTYTQPFRTVAKGVQIANPGDTIVLQDGTYPDEGGNTGFLVWISKAGTASNWITMKAEHKGAAILDCQNTCAGYLYFDSGAAYWLVQGLVFENALSAGVDMNSTPAAHDLTFKGNVFMNIGRYYTDSQYGMSGIYAGPGHYNLTFDGNVFHDIGRTGPTNMMAHDHGLYLHSSNSTIINNVFYSLPSGWGVQTASGFSGVIENNTFAFPMSTQVGQLMLWDVNGDVTIRNNIFYQPLSTAITTYGFSPTSCTIDHNLIYGTSTVINGSGCNVSNTIFADPKLVNATTTPYDFSLQAGSPAIDAGATLAGVTTDFNGVSRPQGLGYDIGAYEYVSSSSATPPPPAPPVISNVAASAITTSSATITWTTDQPADSQVEYGLSTAYGSASPLDTTLVASHTVVLGNLAPGTTYHYRADSRNASGELSSSTDYTFTTAQQTSTSNPGFAFSLSASPSSLTIVKGGSASVKITATLSAGSAQTVSFSASGLPSGVTAAFSPASCAATCTTTLTLSSSSSAPSGSSNVTVDGSASGIDESVTVALAITNTVSGAAAWWKFDEGWGTKAYDSSGNGNTGRLVGGPTWTKGSYGTALSFSGAGQYVSVRERSSLEFSNVFSVSFWIKASDVPNVDQRIVSKNYDWDVKLNGSAHVPQLTAGGEYAALNYSLPMGTWQHIVFTYSSGVVNGYVNGVQQSFMFNTFTPGTVLPSYQYGLFIGADPSLQNCAKGLIDDVRIYGRELTPQEVQSLYLQTIH